MWCSGVGPANIGGQASCFRAGCQRCSGPAGSARPPPGQAGSVPLSSMQVLNPSNAAYWFDAFCWFANLDFNLKTHFHVFTHITPFTRDTVIADFPLKFHAPRHFPLRNACSTSLLSSRMHQLNGKWFRCASFGVGFVNYNNILIIFFFTIERQAR